MTLGSTLAETGYDDPRMLTHADVPDILESVQADDTNRSCEAKHIIAWCPLAQDYNWAKSQRGEKDNLMILVDWGLDYDMFILQWTVI